MTADKNFWRPAYEFYALTTWLVVIAICGWVVYAQQMPKGPFYWVAVFALWRCGLRLMEGIKVWRHRNGLLGCNIEWMSTSQLQKKVDAKPGHVWLGKGFEWSRVHMQRLYDLEKQDLDKLKIPRLFRKKVKTGKGNKLLHGVEPNEADIYVPINDLAGHIFVPATTGAIKTRLLALMASQAIRRKPNESVVIITMKPDRGLRDFIQSECALVGKSQSFAYFDPGDPENSIRLDLLYNWKRTTEVASRIGAITPSESGNDPFAAFGWRVLNLVAEGCVVTENERPTLKTIRRYVEGGVDRLLHNTIIKFLEHEGIDWQEAIKPYRKQVNKFKRPSATTPDETVALVAYYKSERIPQESNSLIDGLISMFEHDREHAQKMLASLIPVLTMLTAGDLSDLLSPDRDDPADSRPILDNSKIVDSASIVMLNLNSVSDTVVAEAIASIFLADLSAAAGARLDEQIFSPKVNLYVDEANQAVNIPFIQLLNKGREPGFNVSFFSQTVPDFIAKLGNEALARQVLGNANTVIAGRIKDKVTSDYAMETFGRTILRQSQTQQITSAMLNTDLTSFTGSYGDRQNELLSEIVPPEALSRLPDLEFFASLAGSKIVKGRIPLLKSA